MSLPAHLEAIRDEALQTTCEAWAIRKRWPIAKGIDRAGPCPKCGGTDRFSIHTRKNTFNCRRCEIRGEGVIKLVMETEGIEFTEACEIITGRKADAPVDPVRAEQLRRQTEAERAARQVEEQKWREIARDKGHKIWLGAHRLPTAWQRSIVGEYLARRGIGWMKNDAMSFDEIRLREISDHAYRIEERDGDRKTRTLLHRGPAMIAAVQMRDGRFGAVHQTWLDLGQPKGKLILPPDEKGKDRPSKKVLGAKKGGAIRLYTPAGAGRMVMGEGIETTLTALAYNFEPHTAYWAGVDLPNMAGKALRDAAGKQIYAEPDMDDLECFLPPPWVEELVFLCDSDGPENHTEAKVQRGLKRARLQRERDRRENASLPPLSIAYVPPLESGKDLNDLVRSRQ